MPDLIGCQAPTCRAPAMVVDRWTWRSTDGPLEHVKTMCVRGHWFTAPLDAVAAQPAPPPPVAPRLGKANSAHGRAGR